MNVGNLRNDKSGSADLLTSAMNGSQPRIHDGIPRSTDQTVTLQTVLPPLFADTELQCRQLQEIRMCRTSESRQPLLSKNLSATSFMIRAYSHQRRAFFLLRKFCCGYIKIPYI